MKGVSRAVVAAVAVVAVVALAACGRREPVPPDAAYGRDARFGRLAGDGEPPSREAMCRRWSTTMFARDEWAITHVSFPETNVQDACFTRVVHEGRRATPEPTPRGCAFPTKAARGRVAALADELEALLAQGDEAARRHRLFACPKPLTAAQRAATIAHDVRVLRRLAVEERAHPYAAMLVPGHGEPEQRETPLVDWVPGAACRSLGRADRGKLGAMPFRAARAADAYHGGVAPVVIVSGGAVHSPVVEAFALMHLLACDEGVPAERVIVEPCADHTHTNLRNGARWVHALGGRAAYLVTDEWIQSEYFQDWNAFHFILGSIDQRSTRDWGYLIGSWRQASVGTASGFWFTPYRFWAEPRDALGTFTCVDGP